MIIEGIKGTVTDEGGPSFPSTRVRWMMTTEAMPTLYEHLVSLIHLTE